MTVIIMFENYYKRISFTKKDNHYSLKKAKTKKKDLVLFTI